MNTDALKIAFETIIIGALALPWLVVAIQLFFPAAKDWLPALSFGNDGIRSALAGVLLVALAYTLGASISRLAEDFLNDADVRLWATESETLARAYCDPSWVIPTGLPVPNGSEKSLCQRFHSCDDSGRQSCNKVDRDKARDEIGQIFHLHESALLLAGADRTSRLRYRYQQIIVLRGATFDGLITCILCLFGWCARQRRTIRLFLLLLPVAIIVYACTMLWSHYHLRSTDPPSMEITWMVIGVAGFYLLLFRGAQASWPYLTAFFLSLLLTLLAYSGWLLTEIQYVQLVITSFAAQSQGLINLAQ